MKKTILRKTIELEDKALDWCIATLEGFYLASEGKFVTEPEAWVNRVKYSSDWLIGGPILERLIKNGLVASSKVIILENLTDEHPPVEFIVFVRWSPDQFFIGNSVLQAAMRFYAHTKLGSEVEIPEELL